MSPAFQNKNFLTLPEIRSTEPLYSYKVNKISVNTSFKTKFSVRSDKLKELLSFYNVAVRALSEKNSYTKIIGVAGEGGIGKSRLVYEFIKKIEKEKFVKVIKINYSDKNNFVFTKDYENLKNYFDSNFLESYKKNLPAIVIFEDLHWYDAKEKSKIEKLLFAFSGELPVPFLLSSIFILTYRETNSSFGFKKYDSFEEILLNPFNDKEASQFIRNSTLNAGKKLSLRVLEKIIRLSAGIPFYLEEFLKSFGKYKKIDSIPESVENLLDYKFSFISEDFIKILDIIAIWDGSIEKEILENICDKIHVVLPSQKYIDNTGIVKAEKNKNVVSYLFNHDIYKSYVHNKIDKNWEILLHKSIAGILKKLKEQSEHTLYRLFYHCKHAEEFEQAYDFLEKYLNNIIEQREFEIALQHLDELMEYYAKNEYKKLEIWLMKIKCLRVLIRAAEMDTELKRIGPSVKKYRCSEIYLKYLWLIAEYFLLSNNFTGAFRVIQKGLKYSKEQKSIRMEAEFQFVLARNLNTTGKVNECLMQSSKLLHLGRELNEKRFFYWANYLLAVNLQILQDYKQSNIIIDKCILEAKSEEDLLFLNLFNKIKAKYYFLITDYQKFIELTEIQYRMDLKIGDFHVVIQTLFNMANCLIMLNEKEKAKNILASVLGLSLKNKSKLFQKRAYEGLFGLYLESDDFEEAEKIGSHLAKLYDKNDHRNIAILYSNLMEIYFSFNDMKKCYDCYRKAIYNSLKNKSFARTVITHYNIGYAFYLSGDIELGEKYVKKSFGLMKKNLKATYMYDVAITYAEILLRKGEIVKSIKILSNAKTHFSTGKVDNEMEVLEIFYKLLINSYEEKKFEEFLISDMLINFLLNEKVNFINKIKIVYFALVVSHKMNHHLTFENINNLKKYLNLKVNSQNRAILFYLTQIS